MTDFLSSHTGGEKVILNLAGRDATEEYDPIHPPGIFEEGLKPQAFIGTVNLNELLNYKAPAEDQGDVQGLPSVEELLSLEEIEVVAIKKVSKRAWAYYYSGSDDQITKHFDTTVYRSILLRPRIFVDCTRCDLGTTVLGHKFGLPIYVSPTAMARLGHLSGEAGIAEACRSFGAMQIISNHASMTLEQIVKDAGPNQVFSWQIYVQVDRKKNEHMLSRIKKLKAVKFVVRTLDAPVPGKREKDERRSNSAASGVKVMKFPAENTAAITEASCGVASTFVSTDPSLT